MAIDHKSGASAPDDTEVDWADLLDDEGSSAGGAGPFERMTVPPPLPPPSSSSSTGRAPLPVDPAHWDERTPASTNPTVPPAALPSDPGSSRRLSGDAGDLDFDEALRPTTPGADPRFALDFADDGAGGALDLIGAQVDGPPPAPPADTGREMRDRFAVGDFSGALILAEAVLETSPRDAEAARIAEKCREVLRQMYVSRLGGLSGVPKVALSPEKIRWLSLDHKAGFLLSRVDGMSSVEEILDMSGMPALEALRILFELSQQSVIRVR